MPNQLTLTELARLNSLRKLTRCIELVDPTRKTRMYSLVEGLLRDYFDDFITRCRWRTDNYTYSIVQYCERNHKDMTRAQIIKELCKLYKVS